ncbi:hypothetical protein Y032_0100g3276 [Ancylostoma ceylanicum]|uniref:Uncharacterized protein n=1 Tax=Ancylostoma ceylanicum TaxID=53326 RepID=A0A016TI57_9BILA|nr:hypothetical protein Y032_0100g3276 [Ancylostoma ceylanicum]
MRRNSDGVHWHLVRCIGGQLIAASFISFRFRNGEAATHTVCHILRIIPCVICLMLLFQCRSMTPGLIEPAHLEFMKYFLFVGLLINILLLVSSGWEIGTTLVPGNKIGNCLYQLDAMASICIGAAWLTFPKWLLHKQVVVPLDESHELCGRIMGALFLTSYAVSAHALHWTNTANKMTAVEGRVITQKRNLTPIPRPNAREENGIIEMMGYQVRCVCLRSPENNMRREGTRENKNGLEITPPRFG